MRPWSVLRSSRRRDGLSWWSWSVPVVLVVVVSVGLGSVAGGASEPVVVEAEVLSASSISIDPSDDDPAGNCLSGTAGVTDLGLVLPSEVSVSADCEVVFGSSNDTSMLTISQTDGLGVAMFGRPTGEFDDGFGTDGHVVVDAAGTSDEARSLVEDGEGSVYVGGHQFRVLKLTDDGAPDPAFGTAGFVNHGNAGGRFFQTYGISVDELGRIWAAGVLAYSGRLLPDGSLDPDYGSGGTALFPGDDPSVVQTIALPGGGALVAASRDKAGGGREAALIRVDDAGTPDPTFGDAGALLASNSTNTCEWPRFAVQGEAIVMITYCNSSRRLVMVKADRDGVPDDGFGTDGYRVLTPGDMGMADVYGRDVSFDPEGRIVVVGNTANAGGGTAPAAETFIARFLPDGSLDPDFGSGGIVTYGGIGTHHAGRGVTVLADGSVAAHSRADTGAGMRSFVWLVRADGTADPDFGTSGVVELEQPASAETVVDASSIVMGFDGRIVTAVRTLGATPTQDVLVSRFEAVGIADYGVDGVSFASRPNGAFGACLREVGAFVDAEWDEDGTCVNTDASTWNPIPPSAAAGGHVIARSLASGLTEGRVWMRFGLGPAPSQRAGEYYAPVTFEVIAPNIP